jgi:hypothetical protein
MRFNGLYRTVAERALKMERPFYDGAEFVNFLILWAFRKVGEMGTGTKDVSCRSS